MRLEDIERMLFPWQLEEFKRIAKIKDGVEKAKRTPQAHAEGRKHLLENLKVKVSALDALLIPEGHITAVIDAISEVQMAGIALACHGHLRAIA